MLDVNNVEGLNKFPGQSLLGMFSGKFNEMVVALPWKARPHGVVRRVRVEKGSMREDVDAQLGEQFNFVMLQD